jgi:type III restriction enzyme
LFARGIKFLSLFFMTNMSKSKQYDERGDARGGAYAEIFGGRIQRRCLQYTARLTDTPENLAYLGRIEPGGRTARVLLHRQKDGRLIDSKLGDRKDRPSDDAYAYDLIMKDKERLLDRRGRSVPVSHSGPPRGWDNPNVFQNCTLKQSGAMSQAPVGRRGLRLARQSARERNDENVLSRDEIHAVMF